MDFMSPSAGTDLASAYSQPDMLSSSSPVLEQKVEPAQYSAEIPATSQNNSPEPANNDRQPVYNQSELLQDINSKSLKSQMEQLRKDMEEQQHSSKLQYKQNYERNSIYDKYVKRKKDISRFLCLALIIIFALSIHDIISHSLSDYINSINITPKREIGMKLAYPVGIIVVYWTMKAFKI
jgi:hypothetical protein